MVTADQTADPPDPTGLTDPERRLRAAWATGTPVDLRTGDKQADDPPGGHAWGPERTIRAAVLAELLTTPPDRSAPAGRDAGRCAWPAPASPAAWTWTPPS